MPVVGRAVVIVSVRSNNLRNDIRDAVNDGFRDADADIDARGREVGEHFNESVAKGLRQDERLRLAGERLNLAIAKGMRDDDKLQLDAEKHGLRVTESIARGMRDEEKLRQSSERLSETIRNNIERGLRDDKRIDLAAQRLAQSTQDSIDRALRENNRLQAAGTRESNRIIEGMQRGLREDRKLDLAADALAERMQTRLDRAFGDSERLRIAGERLNQSIADGVRRDRALELAMAREARLAGGSFEREHRRGRPQLINLFGESGRDIAQKLGDEFNLGIGRAKMGPAIRGALFLAAPALLNGAAALGVAAAGALTAALSSALLSGGLLAAAFASGAESLEAGKTAYSELGTRLGTTIADSMAGGFAASAGILTERLLPAIEGPLRRAGELFGQMFEGLSNTITTPENLGRIGQILDNNNRFIESFSTGLQGLTTAFLTLYAASKPMIDLVGSKFAEFGTWAANALAAAEANGSLATVMDKLTQLADGMFGWLSRIGPAFGDWLMKLDVQQILATWEAFGRVIGGVFAVFGQIVQGAGPRLPEILNNIAAILEKMVNSGMIEQFAAGMSELLVAFTGFVSLLADNPIAASILAFGAAWLLLGGILSPVVTLVTALGSALGALAAPVLLVAGVIALLWTQSENFRNSVSGLVSAMSGKFMEIWDQLQPKIGPLVENVLAFGKALGDFLAPIIERITPIFLGLMDIIGAVLGFIIDQVSEFFGFLGDLLSGDFEGAWEHLKQMFVNLWNFIGDIFTKGRLLLGSIISELAGWLVSVFAGIWAQIAETATAVWNWIWSIIEGALTFIYDTIYNFGTNLKIWWDQLWEAVGNAASTAWNWILGVLSAIWNGIVAAVHFLFDPWVAFFQQLWTTLGEIASTVWNWILSTLSSIWNGIVAAVHFLFDPWVAFFQQLWATISSAIQSAWTAITSWLSSTWESIKNAASNIWNAIVGVASTIWNSITSTISDIVSNLASTLSGWWDTITGAISSAWDGLVGIVSGIWNSVSSAIWGPIKSAYDTVVGWIDDIKTAVTGVIDWIGGKVTEANDKLGEIVTAQAAAQAAANPLTQAANSPLGPVGAALAALASGGVVTRPTMALIGEAGPERVEPLDSRGLSNRDRALISSIVGSMTGRSRSDGSTLVQVSIGDREITDFITKQVDLANDAQARRYMQRRRR